MNKHTPGPWRVVQNWHGKISIRAGETRIANGPHINLTTMEKKLGREAALESTIGWANAKLIAAAPDMLEALQLVPIYGMPVETLNKIEAAITKATGKDWQQRRFDELAELRDKTCQRS